MPKKKKQDEPVEPEAETADDVPSEESTPPLEPPSEKVRKRTMTPEMLEKLAEARKKALEVKRKLKNDDEAKIEHIKERMKKEKAKKDKKEKIQQEAEKRLLVDDVAPPPEPKKIDEPLSPETPPTEPKKVDEPSKEGVVSPSVIDLSTNDALEKMLADYNYNKRLEKEVQQRERKLKQKYHVDSDDDGDQRNENVVYIKRKQKERPPPTRLGLNYNDDNRDIPVPPSIAMARKMTDRYR
jgi:hypothetical protein